MAWTVMAENNDDNLLGFVMNYINAIPYHTIPACDCDCDGFYQIIKEPNHTA